MKKLCKIGVKMRGDWGRMLLVACAGLTRQLANFSKERDCSQFKPPITLAPVVQRADKFIHWIGHYPANAKCEKISTQPYDL